MENVSLFKRLFYKFCKKVLPDKFKRLILLSSLTGYINNVHTMEKALSERLNELLNISNKSNSLVVPIMYSSRIWYQINPINELKEKGIYCYDIKSFIQNNRNNFRNIRILSDILVKLTPEHLMYSSKHRMRKDIFKLLTNLNTLKIEY